MKRLCLWLLLFPFLCFSCGSGGSRSASGGVADGEGGQPLLTVTIEPLRYFTEAIAGNRFQVVSLVPKGSSPETYDPTPQQLIDLSRSRAYLRIGYIGFEQVWADRLADNAPHLPCFDTSEGVELIRDAGHHHAHAGHSHPSAASHSSASHSSASHSHGSQGNASSAHSHPEEGVEPHIWNSATNARIIAANVLRALCTIDSVHASAYRERYDSLCHRIERTDSLVRAALSRPGASRVFMIYHPALSYFARDYGLRQVSIEESGKEPSPVHLKELIDLCRKEEVRVVFVQPEFDRRNAELIARQTGTEVVDIHPLAYDWEAEMLHTAEALAIQKK